MWALNKTTVAWLVLSGMFSLAYNVVHFGVVQGLSPAAACFGGNFNKAALIFLTLRLPFLRVHELPGAPYIQVIWASVVLSILSFGLYSYDQIQDKRKPEPRVVHVEAGEDFSAIAGGEALLIIKSQSADSLDECDSTTDGSAGDASARSFAGSPSSSSAFLYTVPSLSARDAGSFCIMHRLSKCVRRCTA